jgi:ribosome-binding factor A
LDKIKNEKKTKDIEDEEQFDSPVVSQEDGEWEGDDPDEDIIYVN